MYKVVNKMHDNSEKETTIFFNPNDYDGMLKLMDKYAETDDYFYGRNENGEEVRIGIWKEQIEVLTFQNNHWIRDNIYYKDGVVEELFTDKWK